MTVKLLLIDLLALCCPVTDIILVFPVINKPMTVKLLLTDMLALCCPANEIIVLFPIIHTIPVTLKQEG